jgi:hypothetical protein
VLPAAEQRAAVSHLRVPRDRSDPRLAEWLDEQTQRLRLEDGIRVHQHEHVVTRDGDPVVESRGLAQVRLPDDLHPLEPESLD